MSNESVAYSRAGDEFHYRWAARRCLRLIYPDTPLQFVVVEGSAGPEKAGELVIDVSEYSNVNNDLKKIDYYQLKHTTVREDKPFILSDLKKTLTGFAERFTQHLKNENSTDISFAIITNRKFDVIFKQSIAKLANGKTVNQTFRNTIKKYTQLTGKELASFCGLLRLDDSEGNYQVQEAELRFELAQLLASPVASDEVNSIVDLVRGKVLPGADNKISKEAVMIRFHATSERQLYPAPAVWDKLENLVTRKLYIMLKEQILNSVHPVIVHAAGGVGKSVFCRKVINLLPEGSFGIAYDCFGAGKYRNPSEPRHGHRHALVQIANELATKGLCAPLIPLDTSKAENIISAFLLRIKDAVAALRKVNNDAKLIVLIDAADNAEMAASEYGERCFAHELLLGSIPEGCKLVLLCRTERIHLLQPKSTIIQLELESFSKEETENYLKGWFSEATDHDVIEFHRLTSGNPRAQATALANNYSSVAKLLFSLGPSGTTVEKQIEAQIETAVSKIKDELAPDYRGYIDSICLGLASLPPHIPIDVLSKAANVNIETVKSFVADINRALWMTESSVQFRDEPTETWFRNHFSAKHADFELYIQQLEPLALQSAYVAEVLPQLYLKSEQYNKLISLALSDDYLPENNPIDARNIRVYRLQFAFRAALKVKQYTDAIKIAMRAGEETAGNSRQLSILQSNIDLLTHLQSKEKIQEIAFKQLLRSKWNGSENLYTASLLSGIKEYRGEARGYLRSARNWLSIQFEEQKKKKNLHNEDKISDRDILEIAYATLNIIGVEECLEFLFRLQPVEAIFTIIQAFVRRLIDVNRLEEINKILTHCKGKPYFMVAIVSELTDIGVFPEAQYLKTCLLLLSVPNKLRIKRRKDSFRDDMTPAIVSFVEACVHQNLSSAIILRVLRYYLPVRASRMVYSSHQTSERTAYLKTLAIRTLLTGKVEVELDNILPEELIKKEKEYKHENDFRDLKEVVYGLFPWFFLRAQILSKTSVILSDAADVANKASVTGKGNRYGRYDTLPNEVADVCFSILTLSQTATENEIQQFYNLFLQNEKAFNIKIRLDAVRTAYRASHLACIKQELELTTSHLVDQYSSYPDDMAAQFIALSRAVLDEPYDDSSEYFDRAVKIVSKFGDELVQRWEAVVSIAKKACETEHTSSELAYRFIRCAELVGDNVGREKYWNRSGAIEVGTRMSVGVGISSFSRWRDRDIGRFEYQLEALLHELTRSKLIKPATGWALTRFFSYHDLNEFLSLCLQIETSVEMKQKFLDDAVHLLQLEGTNSEYWNKLKVIADNYFLNNESLNTITEFYRRQNDTSAIPPVEVLIETVFNATQAENKWEDIFLDLDVTALDDFSRVIDRFTAKSEEDEFSWNIRELLKEALARVEENDIWKYIDNLLSTDSLDRYDVQDTLSDLPEKWKNRVSFKSKWNSFIHRFGQRYASELTNQYAFNSFVEKFNCNEREVSTLKEGILLGLANQSELTHTDTFFGFVGSAIPFINSQEANDLLDYALSRFELHMEDDFGDGAWNTWLHVSTENNKNIAGFIWSALGSPRSADRWRAAHCVRVLADFDCSEILDSLMEWLAHGKVDAFGSKQFPFYNLHARLYLLIALARISISKPLILHRYNEVFPKYALSESHALIEKFASDIIVNIEKSLPGSYSKEVLQAVDNIGKSKLPIQEENYNYKTDSYWHIHRLINTEIDFSFSYDFDNYWFKPLRKIFGLSEKQFEDLASNLVVNEWGWKEKIGYRNDPIVNLWETGSDQKETWHDHSEYPRTDDLSFYLSYHAMLVIAAKLIDKMPIISRKSEDEDDHDPWNYWISRHFLSRDDGKWLSDVKSPLPVRSSDWVTKELEENWKTNISEENFYRCIIDDKDGTSWIYVKGGWHEKHSNNIESFSVSAAMVSKKTADALLRALATCEDPNDYKLPYRGEHDMEIDSGKFKLTGWIKNQSNSKQLDEFDPYADHVQYPLYILSNDVIEYMHLQIHDDGRYWSFMNSGELALICESWSSHREKRDEEPDQVGLRLKASLSFLKQLCASFNCELIFEVSIKRDVTYRYRSYDEKREYAKPKYKIFILSADGRLRTTNESYQLG